MDELVMQPGGLSEGARLGNTFVAPSKTFGDVLRKATWYVPFVLMVVVGFFYTTAIDKKVGFDAVTQQQIEQSKMMSERFDAMSAGDRAKAIAQQEKSTQGFTYGFSAIILIWGLLMAFLYWMSMNFVMGANLKYKQVLAMWMYGALPGTVKVLISGCLLWAGVGTEGFNIKNPLGTNPGYYLPDVSPTLRAGLEFFDLFGIWSLVLMVIGLSVMSGKSKTQAAVVVFGWWCFGLLLTVAASAMFG